MEAADHATPTGERARHDRRRGVVLDTEGTALGPGRIVVQRGPVGYVCAGIGDGARVLRAAFEQCGVLGGDTVHAQQRAESAAIGWLKLGVPLAEFDDPSLRRLALLAALSKAGFDPDQPRDDHGRWSDQGGAAGYLAPQGANPFTRPSVWSAVGQAAARLLPALGELAARYSAPTLALGIIFIPRDSGSVVDGRVPENPDISFHWDRPEGVLTLYQDGPEGRRKIYSDQYDGDGIFRDRNGRAIGRVVEDGALILDPDALPGGRPQDEPLLCPDPDDENIKGRSERALRYQEYVTNLPRGLDVTLTDPLSPRDVSFDGCRDGDGTMLEAKGFGYLALMRRTNQEPWENAVKKLDQQVDRQARAAKAAGRQVEWYFAEKPVYEFFQQRWGSRYSNVTFYHKPFREDQ